MASDRQLVSNQVLARDDMRWSHFVQKPLYSAFPRFIEGDGGDSLQNVYATGRNTHLENGRRRVVEVARSRGSA